MTDLASLDPEDWEAQQQIVRMHNTAELRELLQSLKPVVMGWASSTPPAPALIRVYLAALKDLGQLYHVYDMPAPVESEQKAVLAFEAQQAQVLGQLEVLAGKVARQGRAS